MKPDRQRRYLRFLGARPEADVEDEIAFHLEMRARELAARGLDIEAARAEAQRRFGDRTRVEAEMRRLERERSRQTSRLAALRDLRGDITFVVRSLVRQPVFTISAILTLGLSIGVNTSIFSAVNAFLLRPLPVRDAERLTAVAAASRKDGLVGNIPFPVYREVAKMHGTFERAVAWVGWEVALRTQDEAERGFVMAATSNYFDALGVTAALGRPYTSSDGAARSPVLVISDTYWKREFNRDPAVIGRTIHLNDVAFTIIGVTPPQFRGTQNLILPDGFITTDALALVEPNSVRDFESMSWGGFRMLAYLQPGVSLAQARLALTALGAELARAHPADMSDVQLVMERELRTRPEYAVSRLTPWVVGVFFGMVGLALLVACANVANLLLARATARRSELAVRSALGASPSRVVRLLLTESVLLGAASLVLAFFLARFTIAWFNALPLAVDVPISFGLVLDWRVFWYAAAISLVAGLLAGLAPALLGARTPVSDVLRDGGRAGTAGRPRSRLRSALVVAQVAVSFVLLVSGALFIRSARSAKHMEMGFTRDRLLLAQTDLSLHRISAAGAPAIQDRFLEGIRALPGVERAALGTHIPLQGNYNTRTLFIDDRPAQAPEGVSTVGSASVTPEYIAALGLRLLAGRDFAGRDDSTSQRVVIVNKALAEALWPGLDPLGQHVRLEKGGPPVQVVGVVGNAHYILLGEQPRQFAYFPLAQQPSRVSFMVVKTRASDPSSLTADVRRAVHEVNPSLLIYGVRTMGAHLDQGIALFFVNIGATLATAIGMLGLLQTIVGLYGVLSYAVAQRSREISIKLALGARTTVVIREVLGQGTLLVGIGLVGGALLAFALTRAMSSLLYGISPTDAIAFGGSVLVVGALAFVSSYIPAWRASRVPPASAIRGD